MHLPHANAKPHPCNLPIYINRRDTVPPPTVTHPLLRHSYEQHLPAPATPLYSARTFGSPIHLPLAPLIPC